MKKIFFLTIALALLAANVVLAQDEPSQEASSETAVEEQVTAADLGVEEPTVLPTDGFGYFFKNLGRAIQTTLTFNTEKKAELQLKIANERLLEAKQVAEANPDDAKAQAIVEKSLEKYQQMMDKVQARIETLKEKNAERAEKMLDKIADHQLKQQQVLEKIEAKYENLTDEQKQKLEAIKEKNLEKFGKFLERVEASQEKIKERLEKAAESAEGEAGNTLDKLNNLRVIQRLGDKMENEDLREGLKEANQAIREKFFEQMKAEGREAVQEFNVQLENMPGQDADQLRVVNFLKEGLTEQAKTDPSLNVLTSPLRKFEQNRLENLKQRLEKSDSADQQEELLRPLEEAGEVQAVETLDRLRQEVKNVRAREALQQAQEKKVEKINDRLEKMDDQNQVQKLKKEINSAPVIQRVIKQADPELMKRVDQRMAEVNKLEETIEDEDNKSDEVKNRPVDNQARPNNQRQEDRPNAQGQGASNQADRSNNQGQGRPEVMPRKDNLNQGQGNGSAGQAGPDQSQRQAQPQNRQEGRQNDRPNQQPPIAPAERKP